MVNLSRVLWTKILAFLVIHQEMKFLGLASTVTETDQELEDSEETYVDRMQNTYEDGFYQIINKFSFITSTLDELNQRFGKLEKFSHSITSTLTQVNQRLEKVEHVQTYRLTPDDSKALVSNPVAKLFTGINFTGESENYNFLNSTYRGGCHDLKKLGGKVKSVRTFGKCVRLFFGDKCHSWSLAVYPGSSNSHLVLDSKLTQVDSIGPCLDEEFELAYFTGTGTRDVRKNSRNIRKYVTDLVQILSVENYNKATKVSASQFSLERYKLGLNGRLEFVKSIIYSKHLNIPQPNTKAENIERMAIPLSIGGPGNETYNLVTQSESAQGELLGFAEKIRVFLGKNSGGWVAFILDIMYESETDKTPFAFYYFINYWDKEIEYGRILN